jgi:hypothetical protein
MPTANQMKKVKDWFEKALPGTMQSLKTGARSIAKNAIQKLAVPL